MLDENNQQQNNSQQSPYAQPTTYGLGAPQQQQQPSVTIGVDSSQQSNNSNLGTAQQPSMLGLTDRTGFKKGGLVKAKAKTKTKAKANRGDGCATRGFTKGRMY